MKIAVINETSAADKNVDILSALEGRGHEIINVGMTKNGEKPELLYTPHRLYERHSAAPQTS